MACRGRWTRGGGTRETRVALISYLYEPRVLILQKKYQFWVEVPVHILGRPSFLLPPSQVVNVSGVDGSYSESLKIVTPPRSYGQ